MSFILAIDQGTTATTALIMDAHGRVVDEASAEYPEHYPMPGYVEHLDHEIKTSVERAVVDVLEKSSVSKNAIAGIGITNQRETVCLFDNSGKAVRPFIVWQCRRSSEICDALRGKDLSDFVHKKTGLHLDPYFSATKLLWLFQNDPTLLKRAQAREFLFGTVDTYLCHWLSGGTLHITDATNASRTMLMDINSCTYSDECLDIFSVPRQILPSIEKNIGPYGKTKGLSFLPDGIPICALAGDQQAALFGQTCFLAGDAKATFGTGCFILLNTGENAVFSKHGLITSVAYFIDKKPIYCLEGSAFVAGAAVQFLRDNLGIINSASEIEALASSVSSSGGVVFVPSLCGLGAPHWRSNARGLLSGLERGTTRAHLARATLEGIALQNADIMTAMAKDAVKLKSLKVDGGAAKNDLLMQIQADVLDVTCTRPSSSQKTAVGAAFLAGLALGMFSGLEFLTSITEDKMDFHPNADRREANNLIAAYRNAVAKA